MESKWITLIVIHFRTTEKVIIQSGKGDVK